MSVLHYGPPGIYKAMLDHPGIDLNTSDGNGETVLHKLVQEGGLASVQDIVPRCAGIINRTAKGKTALCLAVASPEGSSTDIVRTLLQVSNIDAGIPDL